MIVCYVCTACGRVVEDPQHFVRKHQLIGMDHYARKAHFAEPADIVVRGLPKAPTRATTENVPG